MEEINSPEEPDEQFMEEDIQLIEEDYQQSKGKDSSGSIDDLLKEFRKELDSIRSLSVFSGETQKGELENQVVTTDDGVEEVIIDEVKGNINVPLEIDEVEMEKRVEESQFDEVKSKEIENIELKNEVERLKSRVQFLESQVGVLQQNFDLIINVLKRKN